MALRRQRTGRPPTLVLAYFRRRTAWYLSRLDPRARALLRLLPALLSARFRHSGFERETPGVLLMPRRRRWAALCQRVDLPPPQAWGFARPLIQSVVLVPRGPQSHELLFFPVEDLQSHERGRVVDRIEALRALAFRVAPDLDVRLSDPGQLTPAMLAWAAVVAGDLPSLIDLPLDLLDLVQRAPSPLARAVALMVPSEARHPVESAHASRALQVTAPESFIARWSNSDAGLRATVIANHPGPSVRDVMECGKGLQTAGLAAWRRLPHGARVGLNRLVRLELLSAGLPDALRPALERALVGQKVSERSEDGRWSLAVDGVDLGFGRTLDEARARCFALSPRLVERTPEWRRVAAFPRGGAHRRALVVVEPRDTQCLVIAFSREGRPQAVRVDRTQLVCKALWLRSRGDVLELQMQPRADPTLATRLGQIAALPHDGSPLGVQVGDRLVLAQGRHKQIRPLASWLAWPRHLRWLPEQAEWLAALRAPMKSPIPSVQATVWAHDSTHAAVIYVDQAGRVLHEIIEQLHLEDHLREARELLRDGPAPAALSVSVDPQLALLGGRRMNADLPVVLFDVDWDAPGHVRLRLGPDTFGGRGFPPWSAAVETVFSHWPPGIMGRVGVRQVRFTRQWPDISPLHVLAVRALVLRRLAGGIRRLSWLLEAA